MGYWDDLRASGINLYERYCIKCQTKKSISFFPKHQKYKKSNTCFQCLDEIECTNCGKVKNMMLLKQNTLEPVNLKLNVGNVL